MSKKTMTWGQMLQSMGMTEEQLISKAHDLHEKEEAKCERCGISCHFSIIADNQNIAVKGMYCKFLKEEEGKFACSVYIDRMEKASWCHLAVDAKKKGMLRIDCPYNEPDDITGYKGGKGKIRLSDEEYATKWPELLLLILSRVFPTYVNKTRFIKELSRREPNKEWVWSKKHGGIAFHEKGKMSAVYFVPQMIGE